MQQQDKRTASGRPLVARLPWLPDLWSATASR
jgi:hypothetical protein